MHVDVISIHGAHATTAVLLIFSLVRNLSFVILLFLRFPYFCRFAVSFFFCECVDFSLAIRDILLNFVCLSF